MEGPRRRSEAPPSTPEEEEPIPTEAAGPSGLVDRVAAHPAVEAARRVIREGDGRTLDVQVELSEIPAPPFGEEARGRRFAELLAGTGLEATATDEVGNVLGWDGGGSPPDGAWIVSAHLDTVFPEGTDVSVTRDGERLVGPGIGDNARGLAALLAIVRALRSAGIGTRTPLLFVATVGEEGAGDLRGARHLFREGGPGRGAAGFISLDGTGTARIVHRALGSRRLRTTVRGPGGHSWVDWGTPNPIHAVGTAVDAIRRLPLPGSPRTAATVARVGGGTSVNAIPGEAWIELDLRSEGARTLGELEVRVRRRIEAAVDEVAGGDGGLEVEVEVIGDRPAGETPPDSPLVVAAVEATRAVGEEPEMVVSSTDANVPIALGIPALTLGAGGDSGGTHTPDEWYENAGGPAGIERALLTLLAVADVEG